MTAILELYLYTQEYQVKMTNSLISVPAAFRLPPTIDNQFWKISPRSPEWVRGVQQNCGNGISHKFVSMKSEIHQLIWTSLPIVIIYRKSNELIRLSATT